MARSRSTGALRVAAVCLAVVHHGCPHPSRSPVAVSRASSAGDRGDSLTPIDDPPPRAPDPRQLVAEALAGVAGGTETDVDARLQVRPIRIPHVGRGANARFNFGNGQRGWITSVPDDELLTTPAFANGKVYTGGGFSSHEFYALDAYTGEMDWLVAAPDGGPSSAIVKDDDLIFNTESCTLFVYDARTGAERWHRWLGDPLMSQPAAADDLIFSAYPNSGHHEFGAFRRSDGEPVWHVPIEADVIQAPQVHGDSVYFATMDGTAYRLSRRDGTVHWAHDVGAASAIWVDGHRALLSRRIDSGTTPQEQPLVLDTEDGHVVREGARFDAPYFAGTTRDRTLAREQTGAWGTVPHGEHLGLVNVASGWAFQGSTPAVADGRAYFAVGGEIRARRIATGDEVWRRSYASARGAQAVSPPAVVGSQLVFGTVDGHVYAVDIDTGMTLWAYDVGEPVVFQPIVAQGWVYLGTARGHVIGLELGDAAFDGWHMWGGNPEHNGLVEHAGSVDPHLLASLERPSEGTMRVARNDEPAAASGAHVAAPPSTVSGTSADAGAEPQHEPAVDTEPDLPLAHTDVHATVSGTVARVTVLQQFHNPYARPIEAVYLFPLPEDAAVEAMEMHIGTRLVRARIERRAQAEQTYSDARAAGQHAALLEQQRPNLFAQRVANIQPGERIDVQLEYVQNLPFENGEYEFVFPMVAPHRYDPAHPNPTGAAPAPLASSSSAPPAVAAAGASLQSARQISLALDIDAGLPIEHIASSTHAVDIRRAGPGRASVQIAAGDTVANRDFVLRFTTSGTTPRATVLADREQDQGYFSLLVQPPAAPADVTVAPRDLTFVIDTSSSMHGTPLSLAQRAVDTVLGTARAQDTVNVISFSDTVDTLSPSALPATPANLARAVAFVDGLRATGRTEMVGAMRAAFDASVSRGPGRLPIVVLVTDGYIGNEADVLRTLAQNLGERRVFALGVGSAVNRFLLERAAEIGRGRALVGTLSETPDELARRFAALLDRPVFTDVSVDWGGLDVSDVYPRHVPDLFAAHPLVLSGRYVRGGHAVVRVRGTMSGRRYERAIDVDLPGTHNGDGNSAQRTLWARAAVHDLMNDLYLRDDPARIEQVTRLGLAHHIVTPYTSFVAVDVAESAHALDPVAAASQTVITPARALPGDPEIRIPAPADARSVSVLLPFGDTVDASYEPELGLWTARFLIPRDDTEGVHVVRIVIVLADGTLVHRTAGYTVDSVAPRVQIETMGAIRAGADVAVRATQVITESEAHEAGYGDGQSEARVQLLADTRRVDVRMPDGSVTELSQTGRNEWTGTVHVPDDAQGSVSVDVYAIDLAANVGHQALRWSVQP